MPFFDWILTFVIAGNVPNSNLGKVVDGGHANNNVSRQTGTTDAIAVLPTEGHLKKGGPRNQEEAAQLSSCFFDEVRVAVRKRPRACI